MFQLLFAVAIYGTALSVTLTRQALAARARARAAGAALIVAARDAELMALKAQFQPHFVLNALNSLLALIDVNPALARTMVVRLSDLMKGGVRSDRRRRRSRSSASSIWSAPISTSSASASARGCRSSRRRRRARGVLVPPFLLQPLVENAVKHGIAPLRGSGLASHRARVVDRRLRVVIRDRLGRRRAAAARRRRIGHRSRPADHAPAPATRLRRDLRD